MQGGDPTTHDGKPLTEADRLLNFFSKLKSRTLLSNDGLRVVVGANPPSLMSTTAIDASRLRQTFANIKPALLSARSSASRLNVWTASGLARDEVRTSSVLSWFLNPNGSHGEGALFAQTLWSAVNGVTFGFTLDRIRRSATEINPLANLADRVDVVLDGDDFIVFIEVKIYAALQPAQLERYLSAAQNSASLRDKRHFALIYLAPHRTAMPSDQCRCLSWRALALAFRASASRCQNPFVGEVASQFADHIESY